MTSQWQNFLGNLGEWRGSFTGIAADGSLRESTPSVLTLASEDDDRLVRFGLRRWPAATPMAAGGGPAAEAVEPTRAIEQEYRSLGRQVVFFPSGTFSKGSLQVAPNTVFGGEFGFIRADRRHRLVLLYDTSGGFEQLVLIREFRAGSGAAECPRPPPISCSAAGAASSPPSAPTGPSPTMPTATWSWAVPNWRGCGCSPMAASAVCRSG